MALSGHLLCSIAGLGWGLGGLPSQQQNTLNNILSGVWQGGGTDMVTTQQTAMPSASVPLMLCGIELWQPGSSCDHPALRLWAVLGATPETYLPQWGKR